MTATAITARKGDLMRKAAPVLGLMAALALGLALPSLAEASSSGGGLPWEGPLQKVVDSITGPVAFGISVLAVVGCGVGLAMGGDMNEFLRRFMMLTIVVAVIVFAVNIMSSVFGVGAVIDLPTAQAAVAGVVALP